MKEKPFLDEKLMDDGPTPCAWSNFRRPLLRRFKQQGTFAFTDLLGYGYDGVVWKVEVGGQVYALKVVCFVLHPPSRGNSLTTKFWDNQPPEGTRYWAVQRECQNASLLESMRYAIEGSPDPIWLNPEPKTLRDAALNLHAFSDEGLDRKLFRNKPGAVKYSTVPNLRKCHGWTMMSGKELYALPPILRPGEVRIDGKMRELLRSESYHAIVYEYVSDSGHALDTEAVQSQLDFFWLTGFCLVPMRADNWEGAGVLVDMADLVCPWHAGWFTSLYKRRDAKEVMQQRP